MTMRQKLVKRYYCDHCNKGGLVRRAMERHEVICIKNPARQCPVCCGLPSGECSPPPHTVSELIAAFDRGGLKELSQMAESCPACIIAALSQKREADPESEWVEFDYKAAMNAYYAEQNTFSRQYQ